MIKWFKGLFKKQDEFSRQLKFANKMMQKSLKKSYGKKGFEMVMKEFEEKRRKECEERVGKVVHCPLDGRDKK